MAVSIQLSIVNNIFKATILKARQEIVEYYLEYRRKTYINFQTCNFKNDYKRKVSVAGEHLHIFLMHIQNPELFNIRIF